MEYMNKVDWSPLWISLKTGVVATILAFFLGIVAVQLVMRVNRKLAWILDSLFTLPLVLPPTVIGFSLLLLFSLKRPFGKFLYVNFDIKMVQTWLGCVVAACIIAFPLMYKNAKAAFEQIDLTIIYAARTLGISETYIFFRIAMPMAWPGVLSGTILAFARSIGEYGATCMLAGNILGKTQTVAVAIASQASAGNFEEAGFWVCVNVIISFVIISLINRISKKNSWSKR